MSPSGTQQSARIPIHIKEASEKMGKVLAHSFYTELEKIAVSDRPRIAIAIITSNKVKPDRFIVNPRLLPRRRARPAARKRSCESVHFQ